MTTDTGSRAGRWLCGFHPAPRRPTSRLLMLPHAGGSASFYFPFSEALSGDVDVLVAQYPGRQERHREPSITDIRELAVAVLAALTADGLDDVPLALFGHSMGALVAYEMAGLLEERGVPVARLFVSGCRGAAVPDDPRRLHAADDDALMAELAAMGGTDVELLSHPDIRQMVLPPLRADFRAVETYSHRPRQPLRVPVTALIGDMDPRVRPGTAEAWSELTLGSYELRIFHGDHFFLVAPGTFGEVVKLLRDRLTGPGPSTTHISHGEEEAL
ncbi:alpha/beta fold hydrolase (plasmid) [Streptomyces sp. NBC_01450]|uniref:thioesterase II family protein n=1 Tax=Streptomyces sp. NBC_01450 TaxID=2903871 RepID=UPI002E30FC12|nr:alpha/beta fold hydrolase [Streptomyces sp. NBC_01450]